MSKEINDVVQEGVDENCLQPSENQKGDADVDPHSNGFGRDRAMETAIEQQDQLIVQYMAEENAQREWEQKYKVNRSSTFVCASFLRVWLFMS